MSFSGVEDMIPYIIEENNYMTLSQITDGKLTLAPNQVAILKNY